MILLHCFVVIKKMVVGSGTYGIWYNLSPKVIIIMWYLDSYTTCHFHMYGWPNNISQTIGGETSHRTSYMKGLMLSGKWNYWLMQRYHPWWSHMMVYRCRCGVVGSPKCFKTSTNEVLLAPTVDNELTENPSHTYVSGRVIPPPLDLQSHPSRSWWWK